jgi:hypothetical protein
VIRPKVAPLGVDVASYDSVEPATRGEMRAPADSSCLYYDASGRYRLGRVRTLACWLRPVNIHVVVFGGLGDDELECCVGLGVSRSSASRRRRMSTVMRAAHADGRLGGARATPVSISWPSRAGHTERSPLTQHFVADKIRDCC